MVLEHTLRWAQRWPMSQEPADYTTPEPTFEVNWRWVQLWQAENPGPGCGSPGHAEWDAAYMRECDRVWVAACLPQFRVFDWPEEDVAAARKLVARHVCGVCGRSDDPGCWAGC